MSWKTDALIHAKDQDPKESVGLLLNVRGKQKYFPCEKGLPPSNAPCSSTSLRAPHDQRTAFELKLQMTN